MNITLFFMFCFLNLYNSFKFKNYYKLNTKLNMNYYIDKNLHIHYNNDSIFSSINLKNSKSNYYPEKYIDFDYSPSMKLIILYRNNAFINSDFEEKFKNLIDSEIKKKNKNWHDIKVIIKLEEKN